MRAADNPFRATRVDALDYRAPGFEWRALLERLDGLGGRGVVLGPRGSGKSTLLRGLEERLRDRGHEVRRLRPDPDDALIAQRQLDRFTSALSPTTALLLDGADRVGWREWRRLCLAARPLPVLVVTTHRRGRLPTLHRCSTSAEILTELLAELDGGRHDPLEVRALFRQHRGNLRTALRQFYDRAARGVPAADGRGGE